MLAFSSVHFGRPRNCIGTWRMNFSATRVTSFEIRRTSQFFLVNRKACVGSVCNLLCGAGARIYKQLGNLGTKFLPIGRRWEKIGCNTQSLFLFGLSGHRESSIFRTCIANDSTKALWRAPSPVISETRPCALPRSLCTS
jgi:hypothetical protein